MRGQTGDCRFTIHLYRTAGTRNMQVSNPRSDFVVQAGSTTGPADQTITITLPRRFELYLCSATQSGGQLVGGQKFHYWKYASTLTVGIANFSSLRQASIVARLRSLRQPRIAGCDTGDLVGVGHGDAERESTLVRRESNRIRRFDADAIDIAIASAARRYTIQLALRSHGRGMAYREPGLGCTPSVVTATVNASGLNPESTSAIS